MADTWQKARDRIFEEFGIERTRHLSINDPDGWSQPMCRSKVSPIKCELAPQKPRDYGWPIGHVSVVTPRSGKESTMRQWNREGVP